MSEFLVGVDEAGRGPLAGPVAAGVVCVPKNYDISKYFPGLADSKKLSPEKREELYERLLILEREGTLRYIVVFTPSRAIDRVGISKAVARAVYEGVKKVAPKPAEAHVLLDGLLHAPPWYQQQTIIRGDESEPIISLASIVAKVMRDRKMVRLAETYPQYGFEKHKGYGTAAHRQAIVAHGLCPEHRRSFCRSNLDTGCPSYGFNCKVCRR